MSTGQTRNIAGIAPRKSAVSGKIPTGSTIGEIFSNLPDQKLWGYDGSIVFEYGTKSFLNLTGGTITGDTRVIGSISADSYYHDGIELTDALFDMKSNGVYEFSGITLASSTTFNVSPVKAWYVDNFSNPDDPFVLPVTFSGATGLTTPYLTSSTITYVSLTTGGTLTYSPTRPSAQDSRLNIYLGKLGHANLSTLINAFNEPFVGLSVMSQVRDMFTPIRIINDGVYPSSNGANLNFNTSSGIIWGLGINFVNNILEPSSFSVSATTPATFQYRTQTGGSSSDTTLIDPANYDSGGAITPIGGGSNSSTNQRIYVTQNGKIRVQYGQQVYSSLSDAIAGVQTENFTTFSNFRDNAVLIGILSVNKNATDLSNTAQARFLLVSKFGELVGAAGGVSTTTLQQAYNNSANPEIVTNATLDGVQFRGGTGSDNDYNIIIENNAGTLTGGWKANGGLTANTISGGTIYSGSTNLYDIFQPINKSPYNAFILTAGTSYTFSGTVNTLSVNKATGSATQVNLPSNPNTNDFYIVKDRKGDSHINPITVSGGTKTIDGATSYVMRLNTKPALTFLYDGLEYIVI